MGIDDKEYECEDCEQCFIGFDFCEDCGGYLIDPSQPNVRAEDENEEEEED